MIAATIKLMQVLGLPELIIIIVVALLLFGPKKLPELARAMGEAVREFRRASSQVSEEESEKPRKEESSRIRELALSLGIDVANKTDDELLEEIKQRVKVSASSDYL